MKKKTKTKATRFVTGRMLDRAHISCMEVEFIVPRPSYTDDCDIELVSFESDEHPSIIPWAMVSGLRQFESLHPDFFEWTPLDLRGSVAMELGGGRQFTEKSQELLASLGFVQSRCMTGDVWAWNGIEDSRDLAMYLGEVANQLADRPIKVSEPERALDDEDM